VSERIATESVRRLLAAATPGPWTHEHIGFGGHEVEMSARLDTERLTRALLAAGRRAKFPRRFWTDAEEAVLTKHYRKRGRAYCAAKVGRTVAAVQKHATAMGITGDPAWTQPEVDVLLREWGEVSERKLRSMLRGRTWDGIAQQARKHGLPAPSRGKVSVKAAAEHIGLHRLTLLRILKLARVQVVHHVRGSTLSPKRKGQYRWLRVDLDRAVKAVEAYDRRRAATLTNEEAAERCGVDHTTMRAAVLMLAETRPVAGLGGGRGRRWFLSPADADAAIALYRQRAADRAAARAR
jgi:predicted DNA-binding protein (UPF0251 family)